MHIFYSSFMHHSRGFIHYFENHESLLIRLQWTTKLYIMIECASDLNYIFKLLCNILSFLSSERCRLSPQRILFLPIFSLRWVSLHPLFYSLSFNLVHNFLVWHLLGSYFSSMASFKFIAHILFQTSMREFVASCKNHFFACGLNHECITKQSTQILLARLIIRMIDLIFAKYLELSYHLE